MNIPILNDLYKYNNQEIEEINSAYNLAYRLHSGQFRESGEEYIVHPVEVAKELMRLNADKDTVIAGLLHDVVEDTNITLEEIKELFNEDVSKLVDGVTKLRKLDLTSSEDRKLANTRKIITSMNIDPRIIIIKLCDRLHNMRTLEYKKPYKQVENATETLELFVPLADYIGLSTIKYELQDLAFYYINPDQYNDISKRKDEKVEEKIQYVDEMVNQIKNRLEYDEIISNIKIRIQNVYGLYLDLQKGINLENAPKLFGLNIIDENIKDCYSTLGIVHSIYKPINIKFKDYIANPKTNLYKSLHTTIIGPDDIMVQARIRTKEMEEIARNGLAAFWNMDRKKAKGIMVEKLRRDVESLREINGIYSSDKDFVECVKNELFSKKIYVYASNGEIISIPEGSGIIDIASLTDENLFNLKQAYINNFDVPIDYILEENDTVKIIYDDRKNYSKDELLANAHTTHSKNKIRKL